MDEDLLAIQRLYPQVYHACHARHSRSRSNEQRLSERDHSVLAHLSFGTGRKLGDLARHVGIGLPTLSEAVRRLERLGYVARDRASTDKRALAVSLTERGAHALQDTSVLDTARLRRVLARLSDRERRSVVRGLEILGRACDPTAARGKRGTR